MKINKFKPLKLYEDINLKNYQKKGRRNKSFSPEKAYCNKENLSSPLSNKVTKPLF